MKNICSTGLSSTTPPGSQVCANNFATNLGTPEESNKSFQFEWKCMLPNSNTLKSLMDRRKRLRKSIRNFKTIRSWIQWKIFVWVDWVVRPLRGRMFVARIHATNLGTPEESNKSFQLEWKIMLQNNNTLKSLMDRRKRLRKSIWNFKKKRS